MSEINLVIKISEDTVNKIKDNALFFGSIPSDIRWDVANAIVNGTPTKEETSRPHGEWILDAVSPCSISWFRCSYCGYKYEAYKNSNFCPNCGMPMNEKALEIIRNRRR